MIATENRILSNIISGSRDLPASPVHILISPNISEGNGQWSKIIPVPDANFNLIDIVEMAANE